MEIPIVGGPKDKPDADDVVVVDDGTESELNLDAGPEFDLGSAVWSLLSRMATVSSFTRPGGITAKNMLNYLQEKYPDDNITKAWLQRVMYALLPPSARIPRSFKRSRWSIRCGHIHAEFESRGPVIPAARRPAVILEVPFEETFEVLGGSLPPASLHDVAGCVKLLEQMVTDGNFHDVFTDEFLEAYPKFGSRGFVFAGRGSMNKTIVSLEEAEREHAGIAVAKSDKFPTETPFTWVPLRFIQSGPVFNTALEYFLDKFKTDEDFRKAALKTFCSVDLGHMVMHQKITRV